MKIYISNEDLHQIACLRREPFPFAKEVDVSDEFFARHEAVQLLWNQMQSELEELAATAEQRILRQKIANAEPGPWGEPYSQNGKQFQLNEKNTCVRCRHILPDGNFGPWSYTFPPNS